MAGERSGIGRSTAISYFTQPRAIEGGGKFHFGYVPDHKHFSARRRQTFLEAAKIGLESPQSDWPVMRRRAGSRPTAEMRQRAEQLRERRDKAAEQLGLERSFIASRGALEAIAADPARATTLLVPWQRELWIGLRSQRGDSNCFWNDQCLTDREVFWIANILFVRFKDGFPTFRRFIKLSRNRDERVARLHNIGLACFL